MKYHPSQQFSFQRALLLCLTALLLIALLSCNFVSDEDESLEQTQTALSIQQTVLAQGQGDQGVNATIQAQQATIDAQAAMAQQPPAQPPQQPAAGDLAATQQAVDLAATQQALAAQQTAMAQQPAQPPAGETPAAPPAQPPAEDFEQTMKNAQILLFEDMVNDPSEYRYVKRTLDAMGLRYKDDGSAKGWLKSDMLGGSTGGGPWDLVILAAEWRESISGEFFDYLNGILDQGTSVIVEAWYLDDISEGKVAPILADCGVQLYEYYPKTGTINDLVVWPLPGMSSHPVLTTPNGGLTFTKARDKWMWSFDLGDHTAYTGRGDAQILMGNDATDGNKDGVLTVCMNGQFTLMGFSSHSFPYQVMYPLWENMIYNALKVRMTGSY
ncbi:MAG: hypothetical protein JXA78_12330 [Anaerolineales bacterium]|nr:hypothetical protein [Anaerolineales bacterium]